MPPKLRNPLSDIESRLSQQLQSLYLSCQNKQCIVPPEAFVDESSLEELIGLTDKPFLGKFYLDTIKIINQSLLMKNKNSHEAIKAEENKAESGAITAISPIQQAIIKAHTMSFAQHEEKHTALIRELLATMIFIKENEPAQWDEILTRKAGRQALYYLILTELLHQGCWDGLSDILIMSCVPALYTTSKSQEEMHVIEVVLKALVPTPMASIAITDHCGADNSFHQVQILFQSLEKSPNALETLRPLCQKKLVFPASVPVFIREWLQIQFAFALLKNMQTYKTDLPAFLSWIHALSCKHYLPSYMEDLPYTQPIHALSHLMELLLCIKSFSFHYTAFEIKNPYSMRRYVFDLLNEALLFTHLIHDEGNGIDSAALMHTAYEAVNVIKAQPFFSTCPKVKRSFFNKALQLLSYKPLGTFVFVQDFLKHAGPLFSGLYREGLILEAVQMVKLRIEYLYPPGCQPYKEHVSLFALMLFFNSVSKEFTPKAAVHELLKARADFHSILIKASDPMTLSQKNSQITAEVFNKLTHQVQGLIEAGTLKGLLPLQACFQEQLLDMSSFFLVETSLLYWHEKNKNLYGLFKSLLMKVAKAIELTPKQYAEFESLFESANLIQGAFPTAKIACKGKGSEKKAKTKPRTQVYTEETKQGDANVDRISTGEGLPELAALCQTDNTYCIPPASAPFIRDEQLIPIAESMVDSIFQQLSENDCNHQIDLPQRDEELVPSMLRRAGQHDLNLQNNLLLSFYDSLLALLFLSFKYRETETLSVTLTTPNQSLVRNHTHRARGLDALKKKVELDHVTLDAILGITQGAVLKDGPVDELMKKFGKFFTYAHNKQRAILDYLILQHPQALYYLFFIVIIHDQPISWVRAAHLDYVIAAMKQATANLHEQQLLEQMAYALGFQSWDANPSNPFFKACQIFDKDTLVLEELNALPALHFPEKAPTFIIHTIQICFIHRLLISKKRLPCSGFADLARGIQVLTEKRYFPKVIHVPTNHFKGLDETDMLAHLLALIRNLEAYIHIFQFNYDLKLDYHKSNNRKSLFNMGIADLKIVGIAFLSQKTSETIAPNEVSWLANAGISFLANLGPLETHQSLFKSIQRILTYINKDDPVIVNVLAQKIDMVVQTLFLTGLIREAMEMLVFFVECQRDKQEFSHYKPYKALSLLLEFLIESPFESTIGSVDEVVLKPKFYSVSGSLPINSEALNLKFLEGHFTQSFNKELKELLIKHTSQLAESLMIEETIKLLQVQIPIPKKMPHSHLFQQVVFEAAAILGVSAKELQMIKSHLPYEDLDEILKIQQEALFDPETLVQNVQKPKKNKPKKARHRTCSLTEPPITPALPLCVEEMSNLDYKPSGAPQSQGCVSELLLTMLPVPSAMASPGRVEHAQTGATVSPTKTQESPEHVPKGFGHLDRWKITVARERIPAPVLDFSTLIMQLCKAPIVLGGSAVASIYLNKKHDSDYDIRMFNYPLEKLLQALEKPNTFIQCPVRGHVPVVVQDCKIRGKVPILHLKLKVNEALFEIEIATGEKAPDETLNKAMRRINAKVDINLASLYIPLSLQDLQYFEIRGSEECIRSTDNKKIMLVNKGCGLLRLADAPYSAEALKNILSGRPGYALTAGKLYYVNVRFQMVLVTAEVPEAVDKLFLAQPDKLIDATQAELELLEKLTGASQWKENTVLQDDPIRGLRLIKYLFIFGNETDEQCTFTLDADLQAILDQINWKQCFSHYLTENLNHSNQEGRLSTTFDSMFQRFNQIDYLKKMGEMRLLEGITHLPFSPLIERSLESLAPFAQMNGYAQRKAFYCWALTHYSLQLKLKTKDGKLDTCLLKKWPFYGTTHCLKIQDKGLLEHIEAHLQGLAPQIIVNNSEAHLIKVMIEKIKLCYNSPEYQSETCIRLQKSRVLPSQPPKTFFKAPLQESKESKLNPQCIYF